MLKKGLILGTLLCVLAAVGMAGAIAGFHTALVPALEQKPYHLFLLKAAYALERYESISDLPEEFQARWATRIAALNRQNRKIGVYVGEGTNATPFLPMQLEQMGFSVVRFDMEHIDKIKECSEIIFPGGAYSLNFSKEAIEALREYVMNGGGFIGVCLGCVASERLGLVSGDMPACDLTGLISCRVDKTFFGVSKNELVFLHMNGRILSDVGLSPLVWWGDNVMAGTKTLGKGRIVLFSSHPEGGKIEYGNRYVLAEGTSLGTMDLLVQAMFYVARPSN